MCIRSGRGSGRITEAEPALEQRRVKLCCPVGETLTRTENSQLPERRCQRTESYDLLLLFLRRLVRQRGRKRLRFFR
jgi:hypothetical protein